MTAENNLTPSAWERIEGALERARERVPTLTTGLLIAVFLAGGVVGALVAKPFHRSAINKEWRERIASKSQGVRAIIARGDADAEQTDNAIIATLGEYDARLSSAEAALSMASRNLAHNSDGNACRIPRDWMR